MHSTGKLKTLKLIYYVSPNPDLPIKCHWTSGGRETVVAVDNKTDQKF